MAGCTQSWRPVQALEALEGWLSASEEAEDRESAAAALDEYRRDGGASAEAWFGRIAAETRAAYGGSTTEPAPDATDRR